MLSLQIPEIHCSKNQSPEFIRKINLLNSKEQEISWVGLCMSRDTYLYGLWNGLLMYSKMLLFISNIQWVYIVIITLKLYTDIVEKIFIFHNHKEWNNNYKHELGDWVLHQSFNVVIKRWNVSWENQQSRNENNSYHFTPCIDCVFTQVKNCWNLFSLIDFNFDMY